MQVVGVEAVEWTHAIFVFHIENATKLFVKVNPFATTQKVQAELVAEFTQLIPRFAIPFSAEGIPHAHESEKITLVTRKLTMQLTNPGALRLFAGDHSWVLNRECGADNQRRL